MIQLCTVWFSEEFLVLVDFFWKRTCCLCLISCLGILYSFQYYLFSFEILHQNIKCIEYWMIWPNNNLIVGKNNYGSFRDFKCIQRYFKVFVSFVFPRILLFFCYEQKNYKRISRSFSPLIFAIFCISD